MVFNLNIVDLNIVIISWNKKYFIKNIFYYSIKLSTIPSCMKYIRQGLPFLWFFKRATTSGKI
jgi:hypothetical protein